MDEIDKELAFEENRNLLIEIRDGLITLKTLTEESKNNYVAPKDEVTVKGELTVNTEKEVEVSNLEAIKEWLEQTGSKITEAIDRSKVEPITEITVKNIKEAIVKDLSINNWQEFAKLLEPMVKAVENKELKTIVQKQDFMLPTSPSKAIPVRLSDGKNFYNAIFNAISEASLVDDPLAGYQITDQDESTSIKYYGFTKKSGFWYIMRNNNGAYRYAKGAPQSGGGSIYTDAWNNKANLTYGYYYEVF